MLCGALLELPRVRVVAHYRYFAPDFFNPYALPFASATGVAANEHGFYLGGQWRPRGGVHVSFFYDVYKRPWRSYHIPVPADGEDGLLQLERRFLRGMIGLLRVRYARRTELRTMLDAWSREVDAVMKQARWYVRLQAQYEPLPAVSLRGRMEKSLVRDAPWTDSSSQKRESTGLLLFQDVTLRVRQRWHFQCRFLIFDTDDYDSRIYAYEGDVPGVLTNLAFSGRGSHWYLLLRTRFGAQSFLSVKFSTTHYDDRAIIGSGLDEINGPQTRSLSVQLDFAR